MNNNENANKITNTKTMIETTYVDQKDDFKLSKTLDIVDIQNPDLEAEKDNCEDISESLTKAELNYKDDIKKEISFGDLNNMYNTFKDAAQLPDAILTNRYSPIINNGLIISNYYGGIIDMTIPDLTHCYKNRPVILIEKDEKEGITDIANFTQYVLKDLANNKYSNSYVDLITCILSHVIEHSEIRFVDNIIIDELIKNISIYRYTEILDKE